MLPVADAEDGSTRAPPFLFTQTSQSSFFTDATLRLTCPVAGADFVSKLVAPDPEAKAAAKKRAKAPDLTEEQENKRPKKGGGAGKAKAKAKAKTKTAEADITQETTRSAAGLEADVSFKNSFGAGSRPRRWLDDLVTCLEKAYGKSLEPFEDTLSQKSIMIGSLVSLGLEFALTAKLTIGKKTFKDWSKARWQWRVYYGI